MLNFMSMLQGAGASGAASKGGVDRFIEALGAENINSGIKPWDRGIGLQYANNAMKAPDMTQQPVNMRIGQQQQQVAVHPLLQMLIGGR